MRIGYRSISVIVNLFLGYLSFFIGVLWFMTIMYASHSFGLRVDSTFDDGLLGIFLILSIIATAIYIPACINLNSIIRPKLEMKKWSFITFITIVFILGFCIITLTIQ
ncbi:hypothetical protein ACFVP8_14390 [Viridibacillus arvi]|uniref:hypothetical protein n=1 Tax=Viridibacillus arvi TaxID=263475 RepID=UPI003691EE36